MEVNRDFPNLGPFVSVFDQQSNLLSRIGAQSEPGLDPGQFLSPHSIAYDSAGDLYVGDVVDADWEQVVGDREKPGQPRRFQKFKRVKNRADASGSTP